MGTIPNNSKLSTKQINIGPKIVEITVSILLVDLSKSDVSTGK
jgi:hypothetical protein